jgi:uncharacterized protein DUF4231
MSDPPQSTKRDQYVTQVLAIRKSYLRQGYIAFFMHLILQFITLVGATSLPFILNLPTIDKRLPTIISAVVAVAAALSAFGRLGERARSLHVASAAIRHEHQRFDLNAEPYNKLPPEEGIIHFMERIEAIRKEELQSLLSSSAYSNATIDLPKNQPS